jgi:hypothetical protein
MILRGHTVRNILLVFGASWLTMTHGLSPAPLAAQSQNKSRTIDKAQVSRDLHQIGERLAKAVLDKDIHSLLGYDRADLRAQDELQLKNTKSELYCYVFDASCITWGDGTWRSIYDKLSSARQLGIQVNMTQSPYDHQMYGTLIFYEQSSVSAKDLKSSDFLCKEYPRRIASWNFRLEDGKWRSVGSLFDSGTEYCDESG